MDDAIHDDASPHSPHDEAVSAAAGHADLVNQLRQLEDFAARTVAEGEALPPQATEMILHLREIVNALDGLAASTGESAPSGASARSAEQGDDPRGAA
jgi:hypothetical protein